MKISKIYIIFNIIIFIIDKPCHMIDDEIMYKWILENTYCYNMPRGGMVMSQHWNQQQSNDDLLLNHHSYFLAINVNLQSRYKKTSRQCDDVVRNDHTIVFQIRCWVLTLPRSSIELTCLSLLLLYFDTVTYFYIFIHNNSCQYLSGIRTRIVKVEWLSTCANVVRERKWSGAY